jgi:hypothetical protein
MGSCNVANGASDFFGRGPIGRRKLLPRKD